MKEKKLEQQKDEFIGVASHELKTPITSIKAYAQLLLRLFRKSGNERFSEILRKMDAQLNKLTTLIFDLLDVTKIEAGKLQFRQERFDFNDLVDEIVKEVGQISPQHRIVMDLSPSKKVYADRDRVGQVIVNFLTNAAKYSPPGTEIIVRTVFDKDKAILCVRDFGLGIPKKKQARLFERFYRVEGHENRYPGLGLGLFISKEIISRLKGKIWVESEEGKGSTFCFYLPLL